MLSKSSYQSCMHAPVSSIVQACARMRKVKLQKDVRRLIRLLAMPGHYGGFGASPTNAVQPRKLTQRPSGRYPSDHSMAHLT
jgi:hypothetical protein